MNPHKQLRQLHLQFWTAFREHMEAKKSFISCRKPSKENFMAHPIGRTGFGLISVISSIPEYEIRAELYIDPPNTKRAFPILQQNQKQIEAALGFPLIWHSPEESAARRLYTRKDADFLNQALWPEQFEWLRQRLEIMHKVFAPKLKDL